VVIVKSENNSVDFARGDKGLYFLLHNIISVLVFFLLINRFSLGPYFNFFDLLTPDFLGNFSLVFVFSLGSGVLGRFLAYLLLKWVIFRYLIKNAQVRRWRDLNKGISKMDGSWLLIVLFSSIAFMIGATILMQYLLFGSSENITLTLMISYFVIKIIISAIAHYKS